LLNFKLPIASPSPESKPQLTSIRSGQYYLNIGIIILLNAQTYSSSPTVSSLLYVYPGFLAAVFQQIFTLNPIPYPSPTFTELD